jgi:hypothetical protein
MVSLGGGFVFAEATPNCINITPAKQLVMAPKNLFICIPQRHSIADSITPFLKTISHQSIGCQSPPFLIRTHPNVTAEVTAL